MRVALKGDETSPMFLVHPTLKEKDMVAVAEVVGKVMAEAGRVDLHFEINRALSLFPPYFPK